jgi:hypothetical protein
MTEPIAKMATQWGQNSHQRRENELTKIKEVALSHPAGAKESVSS